MILQCIMWLVKHLIGAVDEVEHFFWTEAWCSTLKLCAILWVVVGEKVYSHVDLLSTNLEHLKTQNYSSI